MIGSVWTFLSPWSPLIHPVTSQAGVAPAAVEQVPGHGPRPTIPESGMLERAAQLAGALFGGAAAAATSLRGGYVIAGASLLIMTVVGRHATAGIIRSCA
jgi:hypothetical protein